MNSLSLNQILDIAIVLCAIYAALSTICSWLQEWIAARLALRGWALFRGVLQIAGGDQQIAAEIFNHPLINNTSPKPNATIATPGVESGRSTLEQLKQFANVIRSGPPSYIDARNFSSCFWQVLAQRACAPANVPNGDAKPAPPIGGPGLENGPALGTVPRGSMGLASSSGSQNTGVAVLTRPDVTTSAGAAVASELDQALVLANPKKIMTALRSVVGSMTDVPSLQKPLLALLATADDDYDKLLSATDSWFNAQMDRVSGWYRRRTTTVMCVIALIVVSLSGINTPNVVKILSETDPATRQKLVAAAESAPRTSAPTSASSADKAAAKNLPFDLTTFTHPNPRFWENWQKDFPGLALTWLAVWLGGPFWFDALSSLANVRSAGRKPQRTDDSTSSTVLNAS
jgi:hypothetical protein